MSMRIELKITNELVLHAFWLIQNRCFKYSQTKFYETHRNINIFISNNDVITRLEEIKL